MAASIDGRFATSLFHPDPEAPEGMGRALRKGDTIAWHNIVPCERYISRAETEPADSRRWILAADPVRHADGYFERQEVPCMGGDRVYLTAFDIVGMGNMRIVPAIRTYGGAL